MAAGFENVLGAPHGVGVGVGVPEGVGVGKIPTNVTLKSLNCGPLVLVAKPDHIPARPAAGKTESVTAIFWLPFHFNEMVVPFMTSSSKPVLPAVSKSAPVRLTVPRMVNAPPTSLFRMTFWTVELVAKIVAW